MSTIHGLLELVFVFVLRFGISNTHYRIGCVSNATSRWLLRSDAGCAGGYPLRGPGGAGRREPPVAAGVAAAVLIFASISNRQRQFFRSSVSSIALQNVERARTTMTSLTSLERLLDPNTVDIDGHV